MSNSVIDFHERRLSRLRTDRANFENQWEEFAARAIPAHVGLFTSEGRLGTDQGRKNAFKMVDSTVTLALQRGVAIYESLTMPQNTKWHTLVPAEESLRKNRQVRMYLDDLTMLLFRERYRSRSNFVANSQKVLQSYLGYGNGYLFIDQNSKEGGIRYRNIPLHEGYIAEDHQGNVDTFYRSFRLSYRRLVQMYGSSVPAKIREKAQKADMADTLVTVLHVILPNDGTMGVSRRNEYMSIHMLCGDDKTILRTGGYLSFPLGVARYAQHADETYGRGPGQMVLPAIKVLNEEKRVVITAGHRIVDPILLAHDDGAVGTFSLTPGAFVGGSVNAQGRALIQPLPTGNPQIGQELMQDERQVINDAFLITLFQILVETPQMTATEVLERAREKGMLISPNAGAFGANFLAPMIARELDVLVADGRVPAPPPALLDAGGEFKVEYDNPITRMSRSESAAGFNRALQTAMEYVAATQDPSPLDHFNFDEATPDILDISGAPTRWISTKEQIAAKRQQRAQQAQAQMAIEAAPAAAGLAKATQG